jgi:hypothetical protein
MQLIARARGHKAPTGVFFLQLIATGSSNDLVKSIALKGSEMSRVKSIALIGAVLLGTSACHQVKVDNAAEAETQFEAVSVGMAAVDASKIMTQADDQAVMTSQITMPGLGTGTVDWTTIRYTLADGSSMYVTYDGVKVVDKQRML